MAYCQQSAMNWLEVRVLLKKMEQLEFREGEEGDEGERGGGFGSSH